MPINRNLIAPYKARVRGSKQSVFETIANTFVLGTVRFSGFLDLYTRIFIAAIYFVHRKLNLHTRISSISSWPPEELEKDFKRLLFSDLDFSNTPLSQSSEMDPGNYELESEEKTLYNEVFLHLIRNPDLIEICKHRTLSTERNRQQLTNTAIVLEIFCKDYWIQQENLATAGTVARTSSSSSVQNQTTNIFSISNIMNFLALYLPQEDLNVRLKFLNKTSYSAAYFESMRRGFSNDANFYKNFPFSSRTAYEQLPHPGLSPHELIPFFERYKLCPNEWAMLKKILVSDFWITAADDLENIRSGAYDDLYEDDLAIIGGLGFSVQRKAKIWPRSQHRIYAYSHNCVFSYLSYHPRDDSQSKEYYSRSDRPGFGLETCAIASNNKAVFELYSTYYKIFTPIEIVDLYSNYDGFVAVMNDGNSAMQWGHSAGGSTLPPPQDNIPNVQYVYSTKRAFAGVSADKRVLTCWGNGNFGGTAPVLPPGRAIVRIYSTMRAFLAILDDDSIVCWGDPTCGGVAPVIPAGVRVCHVSTTMKAFAATLSDGRIISWGDPLYGGVTPTIIPPTARIRRLCATQSYFAVLVDDEIPQEAEVHTESKIIWWGSRDFRTHVEKDLSLIVNIGRINRLWGNPEHGRLIALTTDGREVTIMPS